MGCRIRENTWRQCDSKQKRIKLKWRTHAAHTNLQLVVARSSSKSQLKFLFDLANVSDSAGSRRHRWTRDRQPHWRTLSMRERALYIYVCACVCLCVCLPLETAPRSCRPTWTPTMLTKCQQQQHQQHQGGQTGDTRQLKIGYR